MRATAVHALDDSDRWAISVPEAGRRLDISRAHAYRLVASGELPSLRLGHRTVVPVRALEAMLAAALPNAFSPDHGDEAAERTTGASASGSLLGFAFEEAGDGRAAPC